MFYDLQGVTKVITKAGAAGALTVQKGQKITVHCTGYLSNGTKFWSTKDPGQQTFEFQIGLGKVSLDFDL
jgi:FKBP-type peptidyl-prolyl cis-trans isomerase